MRVAKAHRKSAFLRFVPIVCADAHPLVVQQPREGGGLRRDAGVRVPAQRGDGCNQRRCGAARSERVNLRVRSELEPK
jgi:hypothetical protein